MKLCILAHWIEIEPNEIAGCEDYIWEIAVHKAAQTNENFYSSSFYVY